eukprot:CAMPEP_0179281462 /NCGR_PEP_ID=MMETSP0797-20121207/37164_1 /TAXON_ID=47934 /ORGANISM="Dinophysis acuminata, Strain DAEP01" /LENGTH=192 /DNA_ID=CAMNT_0020990167 /DNA_START=50 /DNA_END=628 /DNA_ORIENTATION=-
MSAQTQQLPLDAYLGAQICVVTTSGEEIEGELFCVDTSGTSGSNSANSVIICQRLDNGNVNYKWTKTNIIREVKASSGPPNGASDEWFPLPHVDLRLIEHRAKKLEDDAREEAKRYGVGVTEHAQEVYDALSKTMEAEWDGEDIKVFGVKVTKPYAPNCCTGGDDQARDRVQKVLTELARTNKKGAQPQATK